MLYHQVVVNDGLLNVNIDNIDISNEKYLALSWYVIVC